MSKCCENETKCESSCEEKCERECHAAPECPVECATEQWKESFCRAMTEVQVEILKAKILKAHGPVLEQAADAFLEAATACWKSKIAVVQKQHAAKAFKHKLVELWVHEGKK